MGIFDVPAGMLIGEIAKDFKARIKQPAFAEYVKTGAHREATPNNPDWFYTRMASVLYRAYKEGNVGTGRLRTYYGGRKNRGVRPEKKKKASGKIIRVCLQNLEKEGLLKKEKKGRKVSAKGEKYLHEKSVIAQKAFEEQLSKKQLFAEEETSKRAANRQKLEQQKAAQQAQAASAGKPAEQKPGQHAHAAAKPAEQKASSAMAQGEAKGVQDGRGRTEAKKA